MDKENLTIPEAMEYMLANIGRKVALWAGDTNIGDYYMYHNGNGEAFFKRGDAWVGGDSDFYDVGSKDGYRLSIKQPEIPAKLLELLCTHRSDAFARGLSEGRTAVFVSYPSRDEDMALKIMEALGINE